MGKDECKTMLDALNKVTACYRHLVIALGSTSDSQNLREELKKTRNKAQELAVANRTKLTALLKDKNISKDDRAEYERLWVLFTSSVELLEVDMKRSLEIGQDFPLKVPTRHLIQTGMTGSTTTVAARAMSVQNMKYECFGSIILMNRFQPQNGVKATCLCVSRVCVCVCVCGVAGALITLLRDALLTRNRTGSGQILIKTHVRDHTTLNTLLSLILRGPSPT
uniref:Regulator of G protein signaling 9 binding protein n=1 Tax=Cyprinus carpio TaxID=7962 RepID=A0A8C2Q5N5_CYPCA